MVMPVVRVSGCGLAAGVGNWQKAVVITVSIATLLFGVLLMYYGVLMWWNLSGHDPQALQYLADRISDSDDQLDIIRVDWEYEIVRMECSSSRAPCDSSLVRKNRRSYRTALALGVFLVVLAAVGLCGGACGNTTALSMFVIIGSVVALLEFGLMVALFGSHHVMVSASSHALDIVQKTEHLSPHALPELSVDDKEKFFEAMGWLDNLGNFDQRRVYSHFSTHSMSSFSKFLRQLKHRFQTAIFGDKKNDDQRYYHKGMTICSHEDDKRMKRSLVEASVSTVDGELKKAREEYFQEIRWLNVAKQCDPIWNNYTMKLNERAYAIAVAQNCMYSINERIMYKLKPMDELAYPVLVCGLLTCLGFLLHTCGSLVAHLLLRILRNFYEDMINQQREMRETAGAVTVVNNSSSTNQQQQQQQQQMMQPMMPSHQYVQPVSMRTVAPASTAQLPHGYVPAVGIPPARVPHQYISAVPTAPSYYQPTIAPSSEVGYPPACHPPPAYSRQPSPPLPTRFQETVPAVTTSAPPPAQAPLFEQSAPTTQPGCDNPLDDKRDLVENSSERGISSTDIQT